MLLDLDHCPSSRLSSTASQTPLVSYWAIAILREYGWRCGFRLWMGVASVSGWMASTVLTIGRMALEVLSLFSAPRAVIGYKLCLGYHSDYYHGYSLFYSGYGYYGWYDYYRRAEEGPIPGRYYVQHWRLLFGKC